MKNEIPPYVKGKILSAQSSPHNSQDTSNQDCEKDRLPAGQRTVEKMVAMPPITYDYPVIPKNQWSLKVYGEVEHEHIYSFNDLEKLGTEEFNVDLHCVTRWSKLDQNFTGVNFKKIVDQVKPLPTAKFVIFESYDNYTTNLILKELEDNTCIIATKMDGKEIDPKYGGPVRVVVPHLYGWKSAKFLNGIRFSHRDEPGFWETLGYNNHGDPWQEERYS